MARKKVRILVDAVIDGQIYKPNQVVDFDDGKAKVVVKAGQGDDSKEAVQYALGQPGAEVVTHTVLEAEEPPKSVGGEGGATGSGAGVSLLPQA